MASGTKNKSWILSSLKRNEEDIPVLQQVVDHEGEGGGGPPSKLKVSVQDSKLRIFYPGSIQFGDSDYKPSQGSRLATDMKMSKVPDQVLYSVDLSDEGTSWERSGDKQVRIQTPTNDVFLLEIASKWSTNDLHRAIESSRS